MYGFKIDVMECYDDGLSGELSIRATCINREFHIRCSESTIINGSEIKDFYFVCDKEEHHYVGNPFYYLYGVEEKQPDVPAIELERNSFDSMGALAYPFLVEEIKNIIMKDRNAKRTATRMRNLCVIDKQFSIELGAHFLKSNQGVWVSD